MALAARGRALRPEDRELPFVHADALCAAGRAAQAPRDVAAIVDDVGRPTVAIATLDVAATWARDRAAGRAALDAEAILEAVQPSLEGVRGMNLPPGMAAEAERPNRTIDAEPSPRRRRFDALLARVRARLAPDATKQE